MTHPPVWLIQSPWLPFLQAFFSRAVPLFYEFPGLLLTSWFRTPEKNRTSGGDRESQHLFALAWDLDAGRQAAERLTDAASRRGLVAVNEGDHVHVQLFPAGALARAGVTFPS